METINKEFVRAQLGAASAAGCGAPLDYLPSLKIYINLAREIASQYCVVSIENSRIRAFVARFFMRQLKGAVKLLPGYIAKNAVAEATAHLVGVASRRFVLAVV